MRAIRDAAPEHGTVHLDPDTAMNPYTLNAALRAAGAAALAVDLVLAKQHPARLLQRAPARPPRLPRAADGLLHLQQRRGGGEHALEAHGLERVAIIDFDVHHGNGTEDIFEGDQQVMMASIFQHPFYPYSGTEIPASNMFNVPLAAGSGGRELRKAVDEVWLPALEEFRPELVLFSAGFDAHVEDDMAMLRFVDSDYAWVTAQVKAVADRHAEGRIVSMLEGGYSLPALGRSAASTCACSPASPERRRPHAPVFVFDRYRPCRESALSCSRRALRGRSSPAGSSLPGIPDRTVASTLTQASHR